MGKTRYGELQSGYGRTTYTERKTEVIESNSIEEIRSIIEARSKIAVSQVEVSDPVVFGGKLVVVLRYTLEVR